MYIFASYNLAYMAWTRHYYCLQFPCYILALTMHSFCHWEFLPYEEKASFLSSPQSLKSDFLACFQELNSLTSTDEILKYLHFRFHFPQFLLFVTKSRTFPSQFPIFDIKFQFQMFKILALYEKSKIAEADKMCKKKRTLAHSWWGCKLVTPYVKTVWRPLKINK